MSKGTGMVDRKSLIIPDSTVFDENVIMTKRDIIVGDKAIVDYGLLGGKRIFVGENATIGGDLSAKDDIRIDLWTEISGDVKGKKDIYLGERVRVYGKVSVGRDFDVGDDVSIRDGFEAKGWINIRSPIPLVIYVFLYLLELLRQGRSREVEKVLKELEEDEGNEKIFISNCFLLIPERTQITDQKVVLSGSCKVGDNCKLVGNYSVAGDAFVGRNSELYGALRAGGSISIGDGSIIHGEIRSKEKVKLGPQVQVLGDVTANSVEMMRNAIVHGIIKAEEGIRLKADKEQLSAKLARFEKGLEKLPVD